MTLKIYYQRARFELGQPVEKLIFKDTVGNTFLCGKEKKTIKESPVIPIGITE
jgi:hypothetical protein